MGSNLQVTMPMDEYKSLLSKIENLEARLMNNREQGPRISIGYHIPRNRCYIYHSSVGMEGTTGNSFNDAEIQNLILCYNNLRKDYEILLSKSIEKEKKRFSLFGGNR